MRSTFLEIVPVLLLCSCASSPPRSTAASPAPAEPAPVTASADSTPPPMGGRLTAEEVPKFGPGQCRDSFDCVDTVGFPASGYRWSCDNGKCGRAKLPALGGEPAAPEAASATAESEEKAQPKRAAGRRKR